ncbi:YybH family protein [Thalassobellus citreus]|uniref:YybH family protein n=1 Tax=Thalassobellus citreus TaxID=3367752 RepID=UPI00379462F9
MIYKTQSKLLMVILFFMTTITINAQTKNTKKMTEEQQNVLNTITKMTKAFQNKDIDGVMACYEPNAVVVFEPESPISDTTILQNMFTGMSKANPVFTYSGHEVFITGNIATHIAPWKMTAKAPDGTDIKQNGLSVAVLRKQENGQWLMLLDNPHGQFLMNK